VSLVVSAQDVTERMESERRFEAVLDSTVQFLALLAPDGRVLQTSERALAYGDLAPADVADAPLWAAPWFEPGETAATVERAVTRASDGDRFHGEVTVDAGEDRAVLDFSVTPVADERGEVALLVAEGNDVTDRERRERELQRHNERLDEFTSVVSHDLRGPLGVLRGSLDVAEETGDAEQFARCRRAADRMERTIEDLLELAREGDAVTDTAAVSLADVATASWDTADTGEATLRTAGDAALLADEHRLERLLANLYRNAVEHSEDAVTLTVGPTDEGFYVADDGPGIPPEEREQVFDSGYSTAEGGTGLGLPIVERIAEAHGWTVDVTDSEAGGARFEVGGVERTGE
jgi:PAS domain S-box-containing protein